MFLSTRGPGRPGADADDGNNDGTDPDESKVDGNGDTKTDTGINCFYLAFFMCTECLILTVLFLYLMQTYTQNNINVYLQIYTNIFR